MISFYGGPNGIQGEQGIQGEKGKSFSITNLKIEDNYSFTEEDKVKYNSDLGTWLGVYSTNTNFNIMQYQTETKEVQSFLLGTLAQPLWYKIQNDNLVTSDKNIYLTRDNSNNLIEGQLDFSINNNRIKISTKIDGVDKIYESPVPYELDNENGYLTSNNVKQDQIGDIKLRALEDDGSLTKDGKWVEANKQVKIKREESAPFFDKILPSRAELLDAGVFSFVSKENFNIALVEYKDLINLDNAYMQFKNASICYDHINKFFCGYFEIIENSLIIFIYYDENFNIQKIIKILKKDEEEIYNYWLSESLKLEENHILSFKFTEDNFLYSFLSQPKVIFYVSKDIPGVGYKLSPEAGWLVGENLFMRQEGYWDNSKYYTALLQLNISTNIVSLITQDIQKNRSPIDFKAFSAIDETIILFSARDQNQTTANYYIYGYSLIDKEIFPTYLSTNNNAAGNLFGYKYQDGNYFVYLDKIYRLNDNLSVTVLATLPDSPQNNESFKKFFSKIINNEFLLIYDYCFHLSEFYTYRLPSNFKKPTTITSFQFIGTSMFYEDKKNKTGLRNFEKDFIPTVQEILYNFPKVTDAEYEYLKIK